MAKAFVAWNGAFWEMILNPVGNVINIKIHVQLCISIFSIDIFKEINKITAPNANRNSPRYQYSDPASLLRTALGLVDSK